MCGATSYSNAFVMPLRGLSPRVRGNPSWASFADSARGPIPACAGQPNPALALDFFKGAYPRVCGATLLRFFAALLQLGLSPRVRGNPT